MEKFCRLPQEVQLFVILVAMYSFLRVDKSDNISEGNERTFTKGVEPQGLKLKSVQ